MVKNFPANAGDTKNTGLIPGLGRSLGVGNGNPLQRSCLGNPMDRETWWAIVHGVLKVGHDWSCVHTHTHKHTHTHTVNMFWVCPGLQTPIGLAPDINPPQGLFTSCCFYLQCSPSRYPSTGPDFSPPPYFYSSAGTDELQSMAKLAFLPIHINEVL